MWDRKGRGYNKGEKDKKTKAEALRRSVLAAIDRRMFVCHEQHPLL